jgi:hypothetical protein
VKAGQDAAGRRAGLCREPVRRGLKPVAGQALADVLSAELLARPAHRVSGHPASRTMDDRARNQASNPASSGGLITAEIAAKTVLRLRLRLPVSLLPGWAGRRRRSACAVRPRALRKCRAFCGFMYAG